MRLLILGCLAVGLAGCQRQEPEAPPEARPAAQSSSSSESPSEPAPQPEAHVVWARATAKGQDEAAVYAIIHNHHGGADQLVGADTSRAQSAMLHSGGVTNGIAQMRHVHALELHSGHGMELAPGGDHIMLTGLGSPLKSGERFPMTLHFKRAGDQAVRVVVVPPGANAPDEF